MPRVIIMDHGFSAIGNKDLVRAQLLQIHRLA